MTNRGDPNDVRWPADDPWWRFTPRNLAVGYLSVFAALVCLGGSVYSLLRGHLGTTYTVFFAGLGLLSVFWLVQATNGLKVVLRRRGGP
ncbi:hypothetical protein [Actinomadura sp. DC4]|uniref:hypothetical protein n=1 Tax=Actinomadura sp. DC4 TaxID=3055069 RepID=UPI0025B0A104|nr:hypothetical protein [Actinomadura sp. DC4]MDN3355968.1 hypothetical protein [Actinomadura sp. DC4]